MEYRVVEHETPRVVTHEYSSRFPRVSRSSRIIRTSQRELGRSSGLEGSNNWVYESRVIGSRPVDRSRVVMARPSQPYNNEDRTIYQSDNYNRRFGDDPYHGSVVTRTYTRPSRPRVLESNSNYPVERVVRYSRREYSERPGSNVASDRDRVVRYSREGYTCNPEYAFENGKERVVRYSRRDYSRRPDSSFGYDRERVVRYSEYRRPSYYCTTYENGSKVLNNEETVTSRIAPLVETKESRPMRYSRPNQTPPARVSYTGKNRIVLDNWTSYRNFQNEPRVYRSILNDDKPYQSQREVRYTEPEVSRTSYRYITNTPTPAVTSRVYSSTKAPIVTRTSRIIRTSVRRGEPDRPN